MVPSPNSAAAERSARRRPVGPTPATVLGPALALALALTIAACSSDEGATPALTIATTTTAAGATVAEDPPTGVAAGEGGAAGDAVETDTGAESTGETEEQQAAAEPVDPEPLAGNYVPQVVAEYPHDTTVFTQGLEFVDDALLESGGGWGASSLRLFDPETGADFWRLDLAEEDLFAEGVTVVDGQALQLTWQSETLLVTDLAEPTTSTPPEPERRLGAYRGEGWGLCHDGEALAMTDGSDTLTFRRPDTFEVLRSVSVSISGQPVEDLNELACVGDQVLANVWQTNAIVVINTETGEIDAVIDASSLVPEGYENTNREVLNGIAYHPERGTFWLTGKEWPVLYEVTLISS
ncbi:MAG: glutaminyl-peptide cyclotransferase [Actinomycetota bacterium]